MLDVLLLSYYNYGLKSFFAFVCAVVVEFITAAVNGTSRIAAVIVE
jgi:hypothetical protein